MRTILAASAYLLSAAVLLQPAVAPADEPVQLSVLLRGVEDREGFVSCALFAGPQGFPDAAQHARGRARIKASAGTKSLGFDVDEPGAYAVACMHDENGNGRVDRNLVGIPTEGWATSNNVKPALRAPTYEESRFRVGKDDKTIALVMHY